MFCPKCATENPDNGKFCRRCGGNLEMVLAAMGGASIQQTSDNAEIHELSSTGIRNTILGAGFLVTSIFVQRMPGDTFFWVLFMIPAFCLIASGVRRLVKAEALKENLGAAGILSPTLKEARENQALPPAQENYIKPKKSIYETEELIERAPSITEGTTRNLKEDAYK